MFFVHTTPEEFQNATITATSFPRVSHLTATAHSRGRKDERTWEQGCAQSPVILDLCLRETKSGKSRDYRDIIVPEKLRFENASFLTTLKCKPDAFNSSGLKSVFEKLRFRDGLVLTVGLKVAINLCFQISLTYRGQGLRLPIPIHTFF